jgi:hypothetical protein
MKETTPPRLEMTVWVGDDPASMRFSTASLGSSFLTISKPGDVTAAILLIGFSADSALPMLERLRDAAAEHIKTLKAATPPALVG